MERTFLLFVEKVRAKLMLVSSPLSGRWLLPNESKLPNSEIKDAVIDNSKKWDSWKCHCIVLPLRKEIRRDRRCTSSPNEVGQPTCSKAAAKQEPVHVAFRI